MAFSDHFLILLLIASATSFARQIRRYLMFPAQKMSRNSAPKPQRRTELLAIDWLLLIISRHLMTK